MRSIKVGWVSRVSESIAYRLLLVVSGWLRKHSSPKFRSWVRNQELVHGTYPPSQSSVIPYESFKKERPERLYNKGFKGDTVQQLSTSISLPKWTEEIQPFLQNQLSDHTRRAYETDLKQFFGYLQTKISMESLNALRPEHIILFRKFLEEGRISGKPMEKSTINRKLAVVKSFFNWLKVNGLVNDNPAGLVKGYPQTQESSLKGLSDKEVKKMLEVPNFNSKSGSLHTAILCSLFYLGLRKGELIGLKVGDLDEERGVAVIKVRGKGHRIRILPMAPKVKAAIENYLFVCRRDKSDKEAPLFMPTKNPKNGNLVKHLNPNAITYMVVRYARKVGILKKISPHSCRATCISHALDKKATHRSVQHMAGWSTPLMIQRYDKRREDLQNSAAFLIDYGEVTAAS